MYKIFALIVIAAVLGAQCSTLPFRYFSRKDPAPGVAWEKAYTTEDEDGNIRFRRGIALTDGTVKGAYGYRNIDGTSRVAFYQSGKDGARYVVKTNEPGTKAGDNPASMSVEELANTDISVAMDMNQAFESIFDSNFSSQQ